MIFYPAQELFNTRSKKGLLMPSSKKQRGRPLKSETQKAVIRDQIIGCARTLFLEEGFENVSMRKIAAKANCTPTTLYHYFHNKRHLLHFLWEELFEQVSDFSMPQVKKKTDPLSQIQSIMTQYSTYWIENPDHFRVIFMVEDLLSPLDEDLNAETMISHMQIFQVLISAIEQGIKTGLFEYDNTELIWQILLAHSHGIVSSLITIREIPWRSDHELIQHSVEITLKGLLSKPR
ncbi:MAG: TetR/AcrR family transcriptional regulator [Desulfobacter sp.]|nr:TetR/AcrR family transcriptional regulator [Desulfobacter sp.]WDP86329.1 MAG: TetR/AcrR family transcriptional regulator [Desulfobacter sp.]